MTTDSGGEREEPYAGEEFWRRWLNERGHFARMCARWLIGRPYDVEDVMSLGALKALAYLRDNPRGVRQFRPWALRILHNLCVDHLRTQGRAISPYGDSEPFCAEVAAAPTSTSPDRALYRGELASALERAVTALPPRLRVAFELRFHDQLSYPELSRVLSITQENARKRVQQARHLLREGLGDHAP
ncbi:MAG: RNA polymerase sigma factor [Nannocystaceae bacterium]